MAPTRHRNRKGVRLGKTSKKRGGVFRWLKRSMGIGKDTKVRFEKDVNDDVTATVPGKNGDIKLKNGDYFTRKGWTGEYYGKVEGWSSDNSVISGMLYSKVRPIYNSRDISLATSSFQLKKTNLTASHCQSDVQFPKENPYMVSFNAGNTETSAFDDKLKATNTDLNFWQNIEKLTTIPPANPIDPQKSLYVVTVRKFDSDMKGTDAKTQKNNTKYVAFYANKNGSADMAVNFSTAKNDTELAIKAAKADNK